MDVIVRIGSTTLWEAARRLETNPGSAVRLACGLSRLPDRVEYLVRPEGHTGDGAGLVIVGARTLLELEAAVAAALRNAAEAEVVLGIGLGGSRGYLAAARLDAGGAGRVDSVTVVGPGMPRIALQPAPAAESPEERAHEHYWSRTIGALGGPENYRRLTSLGFTVSGVGRLGSAVAEALVYLGCHQVWLVDDDVIEPPNLGEMHGARVADVGRKKVDAVASGLVRFSDRQTITPVAASIMSPSGLHAAKQGDVIISAPDRDSARLAAGMLATLYLRPLLDVGTGVFGTGADRRMGVDVRLLLPGESGPCACVLCHGGLIDVPGAASDVLRPRQAVAPNDSDAWRRGRTGSLRSLNQLCAALGVRMLEDFLGGRIASSSWIRVEFDIAGVPTVEHRRPSVAPGSCPLCELAGSGDTGLALAVRLAGSLAAGKTAR